MTKTLQQYELERERKNYKARLRRRMNWARNFTYRLNNVERRLRQWVVLINTSVWNSNIKDENIEDMATCLAKLQQEMEKKYDQLIESKCKRNIRFTVNDFYTDYDERTPFTFKYEVEKMNHIEGESDLDRHGRARSCAIHFMYSVVQNWNIFGYCEDYEDFDDSYEEKVSGRVPFDFEYKGE